jgi:hypothetical protein
MHNVMYVCIKLIVLHLLYHTQIGQRRTKFTWGKSSVTYWSTWCGWPIVAMSTYQQLPLESSNWTLKSTRWVLPPLRAMIERLVGQSVRIPTVLLRKLHWDCHVIIEVRFWWPRLLLMSVIFIVFCWFFFANVDALGRDGFCFRSNLSLEEMYVLIISKP